MARALFAAVLAFGAAGCQEPPHPYAGQPEKNLQVRAVMIGAGSMALEIHGCRGAYEGFVPLDQSPVEVGLPSDRGSKLVFEFRNPSVSNKKEVEIAPRPGYRYEIRVSLKDAIHDIELREIDPRSGASRELDTTSRRC